MFGATTVRAIPAFCLGSVRGKAADVSECLLLTKCRLLVDRLRPPTACIVTRVRCRRYAGAQSWRGWAAYDDEALHETRRQRHLMQATSATAGLHSPKRTGWSC